MPNLCNERLILSLFCLSVFCPGVQHWHILVHLPATLDTALIGRMIHNGRVVRQEMKCGNIRKGMEEAAWEIIEVGLLAHRYATLFGDSIATASFYEDDERKVPIDLNKYRDEYVKDYMQNNVNLKTNACMREHSDRECESNENIEMARVAAISCLHHCILEVCGGNKKGEGCRFGFPRGEVKATNVGVLQVRGGGCGHAFHYLLKRKFEQCYGF